MTDIGDRPASTTPVESALVRAAYAVLGGEALVPRLIAASTDANAAIAAGIPAIAMCWGGRSGNQHSVREWLTRPTAAARCAR